MRQLMPVVLAALLTACTTVHADRESVQVEMANVDLHVAPDIVLHITRMTGRFVPVTGDVPYLDDKTSYAVAIDAGEVALDLPSLNAVIARSLGGDRSNIDKVRISIADDGTLEEKGVIDSAINVPFNAKADVSATADGRIRVHTRSVRGFGVPLTSLMRVLHLDMADLVKVSPGTGVQTDGNDLLLDPSRLLPAPSVRGKVTAARIQGNRLVQTFGTGRPQSLTSRELARNHIYWRGGSLSFGKLTMAETDLELVDMDGSDPFDFSIDHWNEQLVGGYSRTLSNRGLRAYMPDYNDLRK